MAAINFVEVTDSNGNNRLINVQHIALVEEYQRPDFNMIYLNITNTDNQPIIMYVQNDYNSILDAIKDVLADPGPEQ